VPAMRTGPHQFRVEGSAAAHQQLGRCEARACDSRDDGGGGEFTQGGLHVRDRGRVSVQRALQPRPVEQFTTRALGWGQSQVGLLQQQIEQPRIDSPRGGQSPIAVIRLALMFLYPQVHQAVARSGVKAADVPIGG
jgi:hypothetical protein